MDTGTKQSPGSAFGILKDSVCALVIEDPSESTRLGRAQDFILLGDQ